MTQDERTVSWQKGENETGRKGVSEKGEQGHLLRPLGKCHRIVHRDKKNTEENIIKTTTV